MTSLTHMKAERGPAALGAFVLVPLLLMASTPVQKDRPSVRPGPPTEIGTASGAGATSEPDIAPAAQKAGANATWWQTVSAQIERDEYRASATSAGLQAPNRAQDLRTYFRPGEIEVVPRQEPSTPASTWRFAWRTTGWGRAGQMHAVESAPSEPKVDGTRVCYARGGIDEWYENKREGIEQGFTVHERLAGDGALRLEGHLDGALHAQLKDGAVDLLDEHGARVLRYADVHASDANGRALPARLELSGEQLAILIEDRAATYPITVDPLMTTPAWTAESDQADAEFGFSAGTAGDVNRDGYSDVIVGAPYYDNGQTDAGRAYVYLGSPSGLAVSPAWSAEGSALEAHFGYAVSTAGDVNGDGYSDVIVGAATYNSFHSGNVGHAFVYLGSALGLAASPAWTAQGDQPDAQFGGSVSPAGDVNGDGYSDVIVGDALRDGDNGSHDVGRVYLYLGSSSGLAVSPQWWADGDGPDVHFGYSVGTAGDVNGDGYSDVIVGEPEFGGYGDADPGRAYVYLGYSLGLSTLPAWTQEGGYGDDGHLGNAVGTAGDVNGDGYSDVIVAADSSYAGAYFGEGRVFLYTGSSSGLAGSPAWIGQGDQVGEGFGASLGVAGDVNGDGFSDVIVGAPHYDGSGARGRALVYLGSAAGLGPSPAWTADGDQNSGTEWVGYCVGTAGDVNGDSYSDVILGNRYSTNGQNQEGRAFVYLGSGNGLATSSQWTVESGQTQAAFGRSVGTAGDVNGDGFSDVIVGAPFFDHGQTDEGKVFVYLGSAAGLGLSPAWTAESDQAGAWLGISVGTAGDVNGDGFSDVIVGANQYDDGQTDEGRAFVYYGSAAGLGLSSAWSAESDQAGAQFGSSVGTAGDVNGDGFSDVIVGARHYAHGQTDEGGAFVYLGSGAGLSLSPAWTAEGDQSPAEFGNSVGTAGDVNGDGFSDVIVGSPYYTNGQASEGGAFVYLGSATGLGLSPAWSAEGDQANAFFGSSAGTAGDVNGDGFSDVIVGAQYYSDGQTYQGRAFVYHGSAAGLGLTPAWTAESDQAGAYFGCAVGTAGDVNGDGFSDVLVGAFGYDLDGVQTNAGRAYLYYGSPAGVLPTSDWIVTGDQGSADLGISLGAAGDVNGDGLSDIIVGTAYYDQIGLTDAGRADVYYGDGGNNLALAPRQARTDGSALISLLGRSDSPSGFGLRALGRTPAGRAKVRLQGEVKPFGTSFDGTGLVTGPRVDTGVPTVGGSAVALSELVNGLSAGTLYHWRLRVLNDSPFFPPSRWCSPVGNAPNEADVRTSGAITGATELATNAPTHLWLEPAAPNPFGTATRLSYSLPARGPVRLTVYDVAGREVTTLSDGVQDAGRHAEAWDGRGNEQTKVAAGVYFARLEFGGRIEARKIVLVK